MTTVYESDAELVARNVARIERVQQTLQDLKKKWASIDVHMESDDGDVQLSVNHQGRLMSLSLAPGCTSRYTNEGLERLEAVARLNDWEVACNVGGWIDGAQSCHERTITLYLGIDVNP